MNKQIEEIIALQIGKLILKTISDEIEKKSLRSQLLQVSGRQQGSVNFDENGIEMPQ
jgi:hypothetical protein